jgi:hypothetical protein
MAVEGRRGCGYRTVGGMYLVSDGFSFPCDRLTFEIPEVCPCCGGGTKFSRGWTWVDPVKLFDGNHKFLSALIQIGESINYLDCPPIEQFCDCLGGNCPVCRPALMNGQAALLWVGERHYSPEEFKAEAAKMGVSKKIPTIPRDLKVGETWVLCAHKKAIEKDVFVKHDEGGDDWETHNFPGIFFAFQPNRIEKIVKQSDLDLFQRIDLMAEDHRDAWLDGKLAGSLMDKLNQAVFRPGDRKVEIATYRQMRRDADRGITFVPVPDDDPDHMAKGK